MTLKTPRLQLIRAAVVGMSFLVLTLVACTPNTATRTTRLTLSQSVYLTKVLEGGRQYDNLLRVLEKELSLIKEEEASRKGKDLVSKVLILDDIAEIYAKGIVNFQKAVEVNRQALEVYQEWRSRKHPELAPLYVNERRLEYNFMYPGRVGGLTQPSKRPLSPRFIERVTPLNSVEYYSHFSPDGFLRFAREQDMEKARVRILERHRFLQEKLGIKQETSPLRTERKGSIVREVSTFRDALGRTGSYNSYYLQFALARRAWQLRHIDGTIPGYQEILAITEAAFSETKNRQPEDLTSLIYLHYWSGLANLILGNPSEGIHHLEKFLVTLDLDETQTRERAERLRKDLEEMATLRQVLGFLIFLPSMIHPMGLPAYLDQVLMAPHFTPLKEVANYVSEYSVKLNRSLTKHEQLEYFYKLGRAYEATGNAAKAIENYKEAIAVIENQRATIANESQRIQFLGDKEAPYKRLIPLLIRQGDFDGAFEYMERARSRAFVDLLGSTQLVLRSKEETEAYANVLRTRSEIDAILDQTWLGPAQVQVLAGKVRDLKLVPTVASGESLEFKSLATVQTVGVKEVAGVLGESAAMVTYYVADETLSILLLQDGQISGLVQPLVRGNLFRTLAQFRRGMEQPAQAHGGQSEAEILDVGHALFQSLWEPIADRIRKPVVYVVPHGPLHYLPFSALYDGDKYLIDRYALAAVPSATVLTFLAAKAKGSIASGVVFANPDLGDRGLNLQYAENEAASIRTALPAVQVLTGRQATETQARALSSKPGVLHFATHGSFNLERPLDSALLLAGDAQNDGVLTAKEIFTLRLPGNLVVLSACQTGISRVATGDELIGLTRAFMYAGAPTIVATLWNINDKTTADLMRVFYEQLRNLSTAEALRNAQLALKLRYPQPFYWAPFVLLGDYR